MWCLRAIWQSFLVALPSISVKHLNDTEQQMTEKFQQCKKEEWETSIYLKRNYFIFVNSEKNIIPNVYLNI